MKYVKICRISSKTTKKKNENKNKTNKNKKIVLRKY